MSSECKGVSLLSSSSFQKFLWIPKFVKSLPVVKAKIYLLLFPYFDSGLVRIEILNFKNFV